MSSSNVPNLSGGSSLRLSAECSAELAFAISVCERAGAIAMQYFHAGVSAETKQDGSPVTVADKECEALIRREIAARFPDDQLLGEEEGGAAFENFDAASGKRRWIIDPIDGTYGYARGIPIFSTLLALQQGSEIVIGVVYNPALNEMYWAEKNCGAYKNGERIRVSTMSDISQSQFNFGGANRILDKGYWPGFTEAIRSSYRQRGFGDYLGFGQVFEGKAESHIEVGVKVWDLAPMKIIVEEAGGRYSDLEGGQSIETGSCLVSNGILHDQYLKLLTSK